MKGDLITVAICELYGWTYDEYMSQPWDFLKTVIEKYKIERQREEKEAKKAPRKP